MSSTPDTITEAQVIAFLTAKAREVKVLFTAKHYATVSAEVSLYRSDANDAPFLRFCIGSGTLDAHLVSEISLADCFKQLAERTPEKEAQRKRAAAARLLAEADVLAPAAK